MWHKQKALRREVSRFSFVGLIATAIDFSLLNISTLFFGLPLITSNIISATLSSVVSARLHGRLTFNGQRHGHARTYIRYALIIGSGIYFIQIPILYLLGSHFEYPATTIISLFEHVGWSNLHKEAVSNNFAKLCAVIVSSVWNFFLVRRFVFIPSTHDTLSDKENDSKIKTV